MHLDPLLPPLFLVLLAILLLGILLQVLRQPSVVAYLIAGVVIGPHCLAVISDQDLVGKLGAIGVVLLLFFVGMEVSPRSLAANWRVAIIGTALQIAISVGCVLAMGAWLDWPLNRSIVLGFVISLSSTAVLMKLLKDAGELETDVGRNVVAVTLTQDLALIPMLAIIGAMGGSGFDVGELSLQLVGGALLIGLAVWSARPQGIRLPLGKRVRSDHELQVFSAAALVIGLALVSGAFHLSTALGAFVAGLLIGAAKETEWVYRSLDPLRVVFVAMFFVSIGMLIDLEFVLAQAWTIAALVFAVLVTNNFINAIVLRMLGDSWRDGMYAGAMLAQIGELSFVLAAVAAQIGIIAGYGYQMTISVIALSLLVSPAWITIMRAVLGIRRHVVAAPSA